MKLSLMSFSNFKALKFYNFDFQSFAIKAKTKTWKKTKSSLSKKNFDNKEKENQTINIEQSMKTPTKTFNDSKNTKQTKESLNMNENCSFWNKNQLRNTKFLTFNQSLISDQYHTFDPSNQRKEKCQ